MLLTLQTVKAAARTVTLSTEASLVAAALTKGTSFDLRSLKPGMLVDTIVDSVLANGMLVGGGGARRYFFVRVVWVGGVYRGLEPESRLHGEQCAGKGGCKSGREIVLSI